MPTIHVDLKEHAYPIVIGHGNLKDIGPSLAAFGLGQKAVVITNPAIRGFHGAGLTAGLRKGGFSVEFMEVPAGERSKSAKVAMRLIEQIAKGDVKKEKFIVAFGGGVVGDLAGFVAAVYKRGIPYIQVPTTLLAQIDSAIGGKVAIDLPVGKNLVGAFYQPKIVYSDVKTLSTLDRRQIRNGLAEAIKYGVICEHPLFETIERNTAALLNLETSALTDMVADCSRIKAKVVMADEKETKGMRTILNFGHTVGHAIEAANQYRDYHHGEAVALGMRVACEISLRMKLLMKEEAERIGALLTAVGLPEKIRHVRSAAILDHMQHDKKFKAGKNRFVLAQRIGNVKVVEGVPSKIVQSSIQKFLA